MLIAHIIDDRVHFIFEAKEIPKYPPYPNGEIPVLVDISEQTYIEEGWGWNFETKKGYKIKEAIEDTPNKTKELIIAVEELIKQIKNTI
jgi:hypothetical protein